MTDHKACLALQSGRGLNRRLLGYSLTLQDRPIKIVHRAGRDHSNADGFSRQSWPSQCLSAAPGRHSLGRGDVGRA